MSIKRWDFFRYSLRPRHVIGAVASSRPREGSLIRIEWSDGLCGYADLFPWPEYGDPDIESLLRDFHSGRSSVLLERCVELARHDAQARFEKRNLLQGLPLVRHHFLIADVSQVSTSHLNEIQNQGFRSVKVKCGRDPRAELFLIRELINTHELGVRLDFNSRSNPEQFGAFLDQLNSRELSNIEFVEDPFPYEAHLWRRFSPHVPLALDHEFNKVNWIEFRKESTVPFQVVVLKPARQKIEMILGQIPQSLKLVFTNSLDHSVGQMHAIAVAAQYKARQPERCLEMGGLIEGIYEPDPFSSRLQRENAVLLPVEGTGVGFDDLLRDLKWMPMEELAL